MEPVQEAITRDGNAIRALWRKERTFPFMWHCHPEVELTLITKGSGERIVGDHIEPYHAPELVLLGANLPHTWASESKGRQEAVYAQFDGESLGLSAAGEFRTIRTLLGRAQNGLHYGAKVANASREAMEVIEAAKGLDRVIALLELLGRLAKTKGRTLSSGAVQAEFAGDDSARLDELYKWMRANLQESLTLDDAAARMNQSVATFCRFFRRMTGRTFLDMLRELRVGEACRQLVESDDPVTDIAFRSGFGSLSNFNRAFQSLRGRSPRAYRNEFRASS